MEGSARNKSDILAIAGITFGRSFKTLEEIEIFLNKLQIKFPKLIKVETIGESRYGNCIWMVRISRKDLRLKPKWAVMIEAGSSPINCYSVDSALKIIQFLTTSASFEKCNMDFFVIPCSNPDAYSYFLKRKFDDDRVGQHLNCNYPICLGANDEMDLPKNEILTAVTHWKMHYDFKAPEPAVLRKVVKLHESCVKLFISLQEDGDRILFPHGFSDKPVANFANFVKIAKAGKMAMQSQRIELGSIYQCCGLNYGWFVDYLLQSHTSIEFLFVMHVEESEFRDVIDAITSMARTAYELLNNKKNRK